MPLLDICFEWASIFLSSTREKKCRLFVQNAPKTSAQPTGLKLWYSNKVLREQGKKQKKKMGKEGVAFFFFFFSLSFLRGRSLRAAFVALTRLGR